MKRRLLHIASLLLLMAAMLPCLVSCVYDNLDDPEAGGDGGSVLIIRTVPLDSRAGMTDVEKLHSLRVIILHADGSLEENYFVSDLGGAEKHEHIFKVSGNETKKIYFVANEESMNLSGSTSLKDLGDNPAQTLEGLTFSAVPPAGDDGKPDTTKNPEFKNGIPMSACYEVAIGSEARVEKDFFLVRAMTKFTFTFQNGRSDNVTLKEMKVSSFADKTYLVPQFFPGNVKVPSEKFMVGADGSYSADGGRFWIDWLRDAIDKSQSGKYTPDQIGWIKDYRVPGGVQHDDEATGIKLICDPNNEEDYVISNMVDTWTYPQEFYRCESINGEPQKYCISYLRVKAERDNSDQIWENKKILNLSEVKYLFRHTHVNVNVVFGQTEVLIFARIHPWIVIKPESPLPLEPV